MATTAVGASGRETSQKTSCGAVITNAVGGNQRHDLARAMTVVPATVTARKAIVTALAPAPMIGGAAAIASNPKIARACDLTRIAVVAAMTATTNDPARAVSGV